ncbi:hypothetical protein WA577_007720 [Blastocystis sp. JDR]
MRLVCIYALPDEMVVNTKQTCPMHPKQHDPTRSIPVMSGSALDVMCALFLPQWSELKAHEKPVQSLLPAGLFLVTTACLCRRSPSLRTRAVSLLQTLFQTLKEEHSAVEDKTAKSPWRLTASTRVLSSARNEKAERGVRRSTDGADGAKQEHDADPSDGLSAKASVVSRAIPDGDLAAIWRQKRWLEKVDGLVRREDCWATTRTSCAERFAVGRPYIV